MNEIVDTFSNRLSKILLIRNMKPIELSEKTGIDKSKISSYMSGRYKAKQDGIYLISKVLNCDPAWLMGYDVPMERIFHKCNPTSTFSSELQPIKIPLLKTFPSPSTPLSFSQEDIIGYEDIHNIKDPENYYALTVIGDSMEPVMSNGDIVIVHKQERFNSGNTCIVLINNDEITIKKINHLRNGIELLAFNPYYPPQKYTFDQMKLLSIQIIGKVTECRKRKLFE